MEHPTWQKFRDVCKELYERMVSPDYDLYIVKTFTGHDMVHSWDIKDGKVLSLDEIMTDKDALNYLVSWATEEILPEDE